MLRNDRKEYFCGAIAINLGKTALERNKLSISGVFLE
jgi:hypothetical protein